MSYTIKRAQLKSDQIITLSDFPVHHEQCLKIYFRIFQNGESRLVPPVPVIHKSMGAPVSHSSGKKAEKYNELLNNFFETHPSAEYFLLDGSHRTTAATLAHCKIPALVA